MVRHGSATGALVYESTLEQGQTVRFTAGKLWLRIGAPWNLDAKLNGRLLTGLPPNTANVLVTATGLRPA